MLQCICGNLKFNPNVFVCHDNAAEKFGVNSCRLKEVFPQMNLGERLSAFFKSFTGNPETVIAVITCVIVFSVLYFFLIKTNKITRRLFSHSLFFCIAFAYR